MSLDVSDRGSVEAAVGKVLADHGRIDGLVNNAGVTRDNLLLRMKDQVMKTATTLQENCGDILADAREINEQRAAEDDAVVEDTAEEKAE